jgi:folate-binding protein YgfZ
VDLETFDVLRVEAGVPRFLVDMTDDTLPLEAGIEARAISFTKGCYVGQEIIVRVMQRGGGRVARRLVGLTVGPAERGAVPAAASSIEAAGRAIGHLTSVVRSPRVGSVIGLGYVHRDFVSPGTPVEIVDASHRCPAVVTALPFVAPRP